MASVCCACCLTVPLLGHVCLDMHQLVSCLNAQAVAEAGVRPHADQFRSAAAVVACAESSLLAATASRGNYWFALDSQKLRRNATASAMLGFQSPKSSSLSSLLIAAVMLMSPLPPFKCTTVWSTSSFYLAVSRLIGLRTAEPVRSMGVKGKYKEKGKLAGDRQHMQYRVRQK
eukprot:735178-Pelagomonas_calceolata.AAC.1